VGTIGEAMRVQAGPQRLVRRLMHVLMGECLARTHGRLCESKETSA